MEVGGHIGPPIPTVEASEVAPYERFKGDVNPIPYGEGQICPPRTNPRKAQNWLGPEGQAFAAFIII